ncbi:Receptor-type tyrosine-protein phosphatase kappa-like protein [Leptotrombidium deliense]|uniref:protein-tyrosine-phosphatase n=1 Tax=Leptotrombidium deliense TaxID=299467 RepID=A0A443RXW2_9ACAR|nr:Receptor-type tyrosine-protein phosphatase kappa-like protein [Leptotrombidium deliense]
MIYDNNCSQIVTLNELFEDGLTKGHKYWPEQATSKQFGSILVVNNEIREGNDFTLNVYDLTGYKGTLKVEHYFYKEWPDHGVPNDPKSFLNLIKVVRESPAHQTINPVVVHCSAGAGRSCTLILIYNMIEMGKKRGKVDVYKYLLQLKTQRAYAIETVKQYNFVYECLLDYFSNNN